MATPTMIQVTGSVLEWPGVPVEQAVLEFSWTEYLRHSDGTLIEPGSLEVVPVGGVVNFQLMATNDPAWTPSGWTYSVALRGDGDTPVYRFSLAVPYTAPGGALTLGQLLPAVDAASGTLYAAIGHTHPELGGGGGPHTHDDRYYTESEVIAALSGKSDAGHTHPAGSVPNPLILTEVAEPAAPAADSAALYVRDVNGITALEYKSSTGFVARVLRDNLWMGRNETGATLTKGTPVYISGFTSGTDGVPTIATAQATGDNSRMPCSGIVAQDIPNNSFGRVMTEGRLDGVNTSAWALRDRLYVSTTAGQLVNVQPTTTVASQRVAVVGRSHATTGVLFVDVLTMLHDSQGTRRNFWAVGDGLAGVKELRLINAAGTHSLQSNPTAARTWTLPDVSGTLARSIMVWNGSAYVEAPGARHYIGGPGPTTPVEGDVHFP